MGNYSIIANRYAKNDILTFFAETTTEVNKNDSK